MYRYQCIVDMVNFLPNTGMYITRTYCRYPLFMWLKLWGTQKRLMFFITNTSSSVSITSHHHLKLFYCMIDINTENLQINTHVAQLLCHQKVLAAVKYMRSAMFH